MSTAELAVVGFVLAAYALGWWARGAWMRERQLQHQRRLAAGAELLARARVAVRDVAVVHEGGSQPEAVAQLDSLLAELDRVGGTDEQLAAELARAQRAVRLTRSMVHSDRQREPAAKLALGAARDVVDAAAERAATLAQTAPDSQSVG